MLILAPAFVLMLTIVAAGAVSERATEHVVVGPSGAAIADGVQVNPVTRIESVNVRVLVIP